MALRIKPGTKPGPLNADAVTITRNTQAKLPFRKTDADKDGLAGAYARAFCAANNRNQEGHR